MKSLLLGVALAAVGHAHGQTLGTNLVVDTFVGSAFGGTLDGQGTRTMFQFLGPIAFGDGGLLLAWQSGGILRTVDTNAVVTTTKLSLGFVGSPYAEDLLYHDGVLYQVASGAIYSVGSNGSVSRIIGNDTGSSRHFIWHPEQKAFFAASSWSIERIANGTGSTFVGSGNSGQIDGNGLFCSFLQIQGLLLNPAGELLVIDDRSIRKVTMNGDVTTLVPEGKLPTDYVSKFILLDDGRILAARQNQVLAFAVDGSRSVLAGSTQAGFQDGRVETALFSGITGMALAPNGDLYVSDSGNYRIRRIRSAFQPQTPEPAHADIGLFAGITIAGIPGRSYAIESAVSADGPWTRETALELPLTPYTWIDPNAATGPRKFYRVLGL